MEDTAEALNTILDNFQARCKHLENITADDSLRLTRIVQAQEIFIGVSELAINLNQWMEEYEDLLPTDEEGEVICPVNGEPGYRFRQDNIEAAHNWIEEAQIKARTALVKFKHNQNFADKGYIESTVLCEFLKGTLLSWPRSEPIVMLRPYLKVVLEGNMRRRG